MDQLHSSSHLIKIDSSYADLSEALQVVHKRLILPSFVTPNYIQVQLLETISKVAYN